MRSKRVLSVLLAVSMLLSLMPTVALPARAANADPYYHRDRIPEVAIFNAYTGASADFFKSQMATHFYNAVSAGMFKRTDDASSYLHYDVKVTNDSAYVWSGFYDTNLAYLSDRYQELQAGYAVTRTSKSHTHRWKLFYSADLVSYMNTNCYLNDAALQQGWDVARFASYTRSAATMRQGNGVFHPLGYTINGANSRYMTISGVNQAPIRKDMYISFNNSTLYYDGQSRLCTCGGSATGAMVSFYDGAAPRIKSVEIKNGSAASSNFKAGDTITIVLNCSEALRFADDSAAGKGDVYIGLTVDGAVDRLHAHLTSLDGETLTFTYQVPANETGLFTVNGIDLSSAPEGGTALVHKNADIALKQVYGGSTPKTYNAAKPASVSSPLGFNQTTSYVTDMAGNALSNSIPATSFYIDCEQPYVALAGLSADTRNGDVKAALGKTDMDPGTGNYEDNSDLYLGVGDSFALTLYLNEVVTGGSVTVTTNVTDGGTPLTLTARPAGTVAANGIGSQYGKGASNGLVSVFATDSMTVRSGMTVPAAEGIKITAVSLGTVRDASGNAGVDDEKSPDKKYYIDTTPPSAAVTDAVQTGGVNHSFYVPFVVTDSESGVEGLPASLTLKSGDSTSKLRYAVTTEAAEPSAWSDGAFGISIPFTQAGVQQYLHISPVDGETYNFSGTAVVSFALADYAGNTGSTDATLASVSLDTVAPAAEAVGSDRSYDNVSSEGTLTVTVRAKDTGGLSAAEYAWTSGAEPGSGDWANAVGSLDGNPVSADVTASAAVPSGDAFRASLWVRITDVAGNECVANLGEYSYSLESIRYTLDYSPAVSTAADVEVSSLESGGKLVFDARKAGDDTHYVAVADSAGSGNIFSGDWYTASFSDESGYSFTNLADAGAFLSDYTGNLYVTVYSGVAGTDIEQANAGGNIAVTTNAGVETVALRVSAPGNAIADVFGSEALLTADSSTLSKLEDHIQQYPWSFDDEHRVSATLEGVSLRIDLGGDKNGWDYADIDWQSSFIAMYSESVAAPDTLSGLRAKKLCDIGSGPVQTVTLPAYDYESGACHLALVLVRNSDPDSYYVSALQGQAGEATVYIDVTRAGSLVPGLLDKESSVYAGIFEEISYDPSAPIYIPTMGYDVALSVEALDANGDPIDFSNVPINAGALDVVAWNTADPGTKISLSREHHSVDIDDSIGRDQQYDSYPATGKRLLRFGEQTFTGNSPFPKGILGVTADRDNVIAIQALFANGSFSDVVYLTVHPVSMSLTGTVEADPAVDESLYGPFSEHTTSGLVTADPGTARVIFTPSVGSNTTGMKLYCKGGYHFDQGYLVYGGFFHESEDSSAYEMSLQSDGSYVWQVPTADAEAYANAAYEGRYSGIFRLTDTGYENAILDGGEPVGYYVVYAVDQYGNLTTVGITKNAVIADGSAPIVEAEPLATAGGAYTATFRIHDDSLYAFGRNSSWEDTPIPQPMTLSFAYDDAYADAIGASGENLTLTADAGSDGFVWKTDGGNKLGVYEVTAELTRDGSFEGISDTPNASDTYYRAATDVYLTVTVKGMVSPAITSATNMTLNLTATDVHGNQAEPAQVTASVTGVAPQVTAMEYKPVTDSNRELFVTFNQPVQPVESWINRSISGFAAEWQNAFPITNDGVWDITFTDVFGTVCTIPVDTADYNASGVFGKYGFDLSFSTLDYVSASEGVTMTATYTGSDGDRLLIRKDADLLTPEDGDPLIARTAKAEENGEYTLYLYGKSGWVDLLFINLNNIVSGGPRETLYFFLDEFKEEYEAGAPGQFTGTTSAPVTVSYRTERETSPVGATTATIRYGDDDSFSFRYYDVATDFTYTISGRLSDYGITLAEPETPYVDTEAPAVDLVTVWVQRGSGFGQAEAFPGSANEAQIKTAIQNSGNAQSFDFVVDASDYSQWKLVVKTAAPGSIGYAEAVSDDIPGVTVNGNNVLVTKEVSADFYIVVVDNAAANTGAAADNFTCVRIPYGSYSFDTTAPVIVPLTVSDGLYQKTVYIKVTDTNDAGADTSDSVTVFGEGLIPNTDAAYAEYPYKLVFASNNAVVITATDAAGNSSVETVQVTGIDVTAPALTVTWSPCFKDPVTGKLDRGNPTAGPVNTDVVAHIVSDKEIKSVAANDGTALVFTGNEATASWGTIDYTSQRVSVHFTGEPASILVTVTAPNGRSTETTVTLGAGVIDKDAPVVTETVEASIRSGFTAPYAEKHSLSFNEDVYCMNDGVAGTVYNRNNPFVVTLKSDASQVLQFADKAGNLTTYTVSPAAAIDAAAPVLTVEAPDDANATSSAVAVTVKANEDCTLSSDDDAVSCGALTPAPAEGGGTVWTGTVSVGKNGTFVLVAADAAGNTTTVVFTINNIDRTIPVISFDTSTVTLRQDSSAEKLAELLAVDSGNVHAWDNVGIKAGTLAYDDTGVDLSRAGVYAVIYTVEDEAGNVGSAVRYVRVVDKSQPVVTVDGELTEQNGVTSLKAGKHTLSVTGLKTANEPYLLLLVRGIYSAGQMKRVNDSIFVGPDGSFTVNDAGFYTLYIITQSRQTYRTLLYVEN